MKFEDTRIATITEIIYTNTEFDLNKLFDKIDVYEGELPRNKNGSVDKKKIKVDYGTIINVSDGTSRHKQYKSHIRGTDTRKTIKQKETTSITMSKKATNVFRNQLSLCIFLSKAYSIKLSRNKITIYGGQSAQEFVEIVMVLWENYIKRLGCYKQPLDEDIIFLFDEVMINNNFKFDFKINRIKFGRFMNSEQFTEQVVLCSYDKSQKSTIKIKCYTNEVPRKYDVLVYPQNGDKPYFRFSSENPFPKNIKKKTITFIVFNTGAVTMSGSEETERRRLFKWFTSTIINNKNSILKN